MTALRQDAINLIENVPEDKLYFIVQILRNASSLYDRDTILDKKKKALIDLERISKEVPDLDYDKALAEYREERYGYKSIG